MVNKNNSLRATISVDTKKINSIVKRESFLKELKGNKEKLRLLSFDRLVILSPYYDSVIAEKKKKLLELKKKY